jgi:hypothetical protein
LIRNAYFLPRWFDGGKTSKQACVKFGTMWGLTSWKLAPAEAKKIRIFLAALLDMKLSKTKSIDATR